MSILLIGANSDTFTNGFRIRKKKDIKRNRTKELKQIQYKKELDHQIKQKNIRKSQQKQIEKEISLNLEQIYQKELERRQYLQLKKHQQIQQDGEGSRREKFAPVATPNQKHIFPILKTYQTTYLDSYQSYKKPEKKKEVSFSLENSRPSSKRYETPAYRMKSKRIKTQNSYNYSAIVPERQDPEIYLQKLRQYEDRKINEVYEMLSDSINIFNQITKNRNSFIKESQHRRYQSSHTKSNIQEKEEFYELPHQSRWVQIEDISANQQETQWRAWHAEQKLKQLQSYLKLQQINRQIENKMFPPTKRPQYFKNQLIYND